MPNWVDQEFAVIGPKDDLDRFCALAVTGNFRRGHTLSDEPTFLFSKVCPIRPDDRPACGDEHEDGVLFRFIRSRVQAHFTIQTSWDLPRHFYGQRLLRDWPRLSFCCAVNEDMGSFGGVVAGFDGVAVDAVEDYESGYDEKAHARRVRPLVNRWDRLVHAGRPWLVDLPFRWRTRAVWNVDATFDDLVTSLKFRTGEECRRFARRFKSAKVFQRPAGRGKEWRRVRA